MKLSYLLRPISGKKVSITIPAESRIKDPEIKSIHYDSRKVTPGGLFVAMAGFHTDGHDHIEAAVGRGAVAVVVDRPVAAPPQSYITLLTISEEVSSLKSGLRALLWANRL